MWGEIDVDECRHDEYGAVGCEGSGGGGGSRRLRGTPVFLPGSRCARNIAGVVPRLHHPCMLARCRKLGCCLHSEQEALAKSDGFMLPR